MHAHSHAHHTPPPMHVRGHDVHIYYSPIHPIRHSATLAAALFHTPQASDGWFPLHRASVFPSSLLERGTGDPKISFPLGAPRAILKFPRLERRWDASPRPWSRAPPLPAPRAAPPLTLPQPQQLARRKARRASTGAPAPAAAAAAAASCGAAPQGGGGANACSTATPATGSLRPSC